MEINFLLMTIDWIKEQEPTIEELALFYAVDIQDFDQDFSVVKVDDKNNTYAFRIKENVWQIINNNNYFQGPFSDVRIEPFDIRTTSSKENEINDDNFYLEELNSNSVFEVYYSIINSQSFKEKKLLLKEVVRYLDSLHLSYRIYEIFYEKKTYIKYEDQIVERLVKNINLERDDVKTHFGTTFELEI